MVKMLWREVVLTYLIATWKRAVHPCLLYIRDLFAETSVRVLILIFDNDFESGFRFALSTAR